MLIQLSFLSFLGFGVIYPLCFWISSKDPIKNNFLRFHIGSPVFLAGLAIISTQFFEVDYQLKMLAWIWLSVGMMVAAFSWNRETIHLGMVTILSLSGIILYILFYKSMVSPHVSEIIISLLSCMILAAAFYVMNLGHFYLNVHGLKIHHLKNSVVVFGWLLALRLLWDLVTIFTFQTMYAGEPISLLRFMLTTDGIFIPVALFFGVLFPLGSLYFALGTLKLKNTQATTGILYVILSGILLGDLAYKYYLLKYGIPL